MLRKLNATKMITVMTLVAVAMFFLMSTVVAQEPAASIKGKRIVQFGIIVKDIEKSVKRFSEIFGIPSWYYIEFSPDQVSNVILHNKSMGDTAKVYVRGAFANLGGYQFELLQPVSGQSTHMEFLKKHGEGIHHISIGGIPVAEHDRMLAGLKSAGIEVEMQGVLGGAITFTYMNMVDDLGMIFEFAKSDPNAKSTLKASGGYKYDGAGILDGENKKIVQIGIVVADAKKAAKRYEELLGIGPWRFSDMQAKNGIMHDQPIGHDDVIVRGAFCTHEGLQFELLQPLKGPSTHREFLEKHGNGIHHVSFGRQATHDIIQMLMKEEGIGIEMQGVLSGRAVFTYLATQDQLAGIIFEMVKMLPNQ